MINIYKDFIQMNYERSSNLVHSLYPSDNIKRKISSVNAQIKRVNMDWSISQSRNDWIPQEFNKLIEHFKVQRKLVKQKINNQSVENKLIKHKHKSKNIVIIFVIFLLKNYMVEKQ